MGMKFRKQDWDKGMELGVAVSEISQRKHIGEENVGSGTQAEGLSTEGDRKKWLSWVGPDPGTSTVTDTDKKGCSRREWSSG